jgi:subtilisin family serine protease
VGRAFGWNGERGRRVKIAIVDSGIDNTHPAFQDASLQPPPGYPMGDAAYTNGKIIVARSYEPMFALPDDATPRDRSGHGTALEMIAAGETNTGPLATITGVAPKSWLGNYKIFGTPGVNDNATYAAAIQALEDDPTRYTTVQGSSFAAAMVAGAAALVKQANPGFSAAQIKSALVNTASVNPNDIAGNSDSGEPLIAAVGAWKLNAAATLAPGATVAPATVSFGWVGPGSVTSPVHLTVTNVGKAAAAFKISVTPDPATPDQDTSDVVSVSPGTLLLAAGQQADVDVTLQGGFTVPASTTASLALPAPALTCACLTGILRATAYRSISCRCMTVSSARRATRADGHRDQPIRCGVEQRGSGNGPGRPDLPGPGGGPHDFLLCQCASGAGD